MDFGVFSGWFQRIDDRIKDTLQGDPAKLYDAAQYLTKAGGKRVRPLLCMLSCEAAGGRAEDSLDTAAALELIHTFTLIHDDIMDRDDLRRGAPSVHKMFGEATAILAGDLLFSKAFEICSPEAASILAHAASEICEGQELDMSFEDRRDVSEGEYLEMIEKKTAVLLQASTRAGALVGGGTEEQIEKLSEYGRCIGLAFQIHDDILDVVADEKNLGKPVGSDIAEGKMGLIAIKAAEMLGEKDKKKLLAILDKKDNSKEEIDLASRLFSDSGALDYCLQKEREYVDSAKGALASFPESKAKNALLELADYIVERKK